MTNQARSRDIDSRRWWMVLGIAVIFLLVLVVALSILLDSRDTLPAQGQPSPSSPEASAAAGVGGPAEAAAAVRTVEITALDAMAFEPATIEVSAGETVTFKVTNAGVTVHEFVLGDAALQQQFAEAMTHMPDGLPHALPNAISVEPGDTKELTWRFGEAGVLEYACHEPGHYEAGMRGQVRVG